MKITEKFAATRQLSKLIPVAQRREDLLTRHAYARDAGFYRLLPRMVIKARTCDEIAAIFAFASQMKRSVVLRAGGTSLSGQAISDDILVEAKQGWRDLQVLEDGKYIKLGPGVVAARANQYLQPHGYRIGPDPGSIRSALIGGIVANNASGIGSGIDFNSYHTLAGIKMVLTSGLVLDTAEPDIRATFAREAPELHQGLLRLRDRIRGDETLSARIVSKYKLKNTMGYSLNSFLDHDDPLDILAHLMVGSEGTLGFIGGVTLKTIPLYTHKATALIILASLTDAAKLVPRLKKLGSSALEIMDEYALRSVQHLPDLPIEQNLVIGPGTAALLVEYQAQEPEELGIQVEEALKVIREQHPTMNPQFFSEPAKRDHLWKIRRELGPHHAATRPVGTTVIGEDVCFRVKDLARAIKDLQNLFAEHGFDDAVIYGHAGDGNLHFKMSLELERPHLLDTYAAFMEDLVDLVVDKYDGSLKAEHGTGRNMAPFLEREWGPEAVQIMHEIKQLLDPSGILNPDVILSGDDRIHLKHIKAIPRVDARIDPCIECGLCEPVCPSEDFTLTPRQRIAVLRERELLDINGRSREVNQLDQAFKFQGIASCAADGLCAMSCPVDIDTGAMMKELRTRQGGVISRSLAVLSQNRFNWTTTTARTILKMLSPLKWAMQKPVVNQLLDRAQDVAQGRLPVISPLIHPASGLLPQKSKPAELIYFPSCLTRTLSGPDKQTGNPADTFAEILKAAGIGFTYPEQVDQQCCGLSYHSKGYEQAALTAAIQTTNMLWFSSRKGELPIVMDTSPCTRHMQDYDRILSGVHLARWRSLKILDMVDYLHDVVLDRLSLWHAHDRVVLHVTCSTRTMGQEARFKAIAQRCAREVIIPVDNGCCGFAGDKGIMIPGLTQEATQMEAGEVGAIVADGYYSTSRTCELGLSQATGKSYASILTLVRQAMITPSS